MPWLAHKVYIRKSRITGEVSNTLDCEDSYISNSVVISYNREVGVAYGQINPWQNILKGYLTEIS